MKEIRCDKLVVKSIAIVDSSGTTRISIDAGDGDGYAYIGLFGNSGNVINISSSPEGACEVRLEKAGSAKLVNIYISPEGDPAIGISKDGGVIKSVA
jgi:hypothetical protein